MKIGIQLYTLRNVKNFDLSEVLRKVKDLGYEGVEFAGFYNMDPFELKSLLNELELEPLASHTSFDQLENKLEEVMSYNTVIENTNIVIPYTNITDLSSYLSIMPKIKQITNALTKEGFNVYYHNHAHEFSKFNDVYLIDKLLNEIPKLRLELDIYWAVVAKVDFIEYLNKQKDKIDFIHVKDMMIDQGEKMFASVGEGLIDYNSIITMANVCDWWIVENDNAIDDAYENIERSIKYIKKIIGVKN